VSTTLAGSESFTALRAAPHVATGLRWEKPAVIFALAAIFLAHLAPLTFVDPDLFHEMSLAREMFATGSLPLDDRFAYTPTVYPSVHHEWGTGVVLYLVAQALGAPGIMLLKYLLTFAVAAGCFVCAQRRGGTFPIVAMLSFIPVVGGCMGFTTIRAQLLTMACLAATLTALEQDRQGKRRWMLWWLPMYVAWLNLHAGFVVGGGLVAVHAFEQLVRRQPFVHFIPLGAAMAALVMVTPYGALYYPYLAHGLLMPRPMIIEWQPLWKAEPATLFYVYFLFSALVATYAVLQIGWRRASGVLLLAVSAYAAVKHTRHVSIYFVVWLAYVPSWLEQTRIGRIIDKAWQRYSLFIGVAAIMVGVLSTAQVIPSEPWRMKIPTKPRDEALGRPMYPTGAVEYLQAIDFRGNLMVPFVPGGFVSWKLHPHVKVSIDGRYEVAYVPGTLEENENMYQGRDGWADTLAKHPTDVLLVPRATPLAEKISEHAGWQRFYRDLAYDMYTRPGLTLEPLDRGSVTVRGVFP